MPATGGVNGTVRSTSSSDVSGRSATVHFDTPPPEGRDETYSDLSADEYATFLAGMNAGTTVDVTCDPAGTVTGATVRRNP